MGTYVGAIDQGTTSTRFVIVDEAGAFIAASQQEHDQILPKPGWVEHDASQIWEITQVVIADALAQAGLAPSDLRGIGITNQRETTVLWDKRTGEPVANAIVWQDTRTADLVSSLIDAHGSAWFQERTGLPPATYFAGPKARWLFDSDSGIGELARSGNLAFGTIDSWLAWKLTGRHVTDVTNASRTMLMNIETCSWDADLCDTIGVPHSVLPEIVPSIGRIGACTGVLAGTDLMAILGDQQSALFGQAAFGSGGTKATYGTGAFLLTNTGPHIVRSTAGLLTTLAYQIEGEEPMYALEGAVAVAGSAVQWLRDNLEMIASAPDIEAVARSVPDNGDVYFVPAFSGLFAPHWRDDARGVIAGLTRFSNRGHFARAVLEATAYQTRDLIAAMEQDTKDERTELRVDGGMVGNRLLMQIMADILQIDVVLPANTETTVLGAAYGAGLAAGVWPSTDAIAAHWSEAARFKPAITNEARDILVAGWEKALQRSLGWVTG